MDRKADSRYTYINYVSIPDNTIVLSYSIYLGQGQILLKSNKLYLCIDIEILKN